VGPLKEIREERRKPDSAQRGLVIRRRTSEEKWVQSKKPARLSPIAESEGLACRHPRSAERRDTQSFGSTAAIPL